MIVAIMANSSVKNWYLQHQNMKTKFNLKSELFLFLQWDPENWDNHLFIPFLLKDKFSILFIDYFIITMIKELGIKDKEWTYY